MPVNLHSLMDTLDIEEMAEVPAYARNTFNEAQEGLQHIKWVKDRANRTQREWIDSLETSTKAQLDGAAWDVYIKENQLPIPMQRTAPQMLQWASKSPRASLESILEVVDKLGFVVLPVEYVNEKAWANESSEMKTSIRQFSQLAGFANPNDEKNPIPRRQDVYVVAPPSYYSIDKHIDSANPNLQIYAGKNEQAFLAMTMMIPTLREMRSSIKALASNQQAMGRSMVDLTRLMEDQNKRLDDLTKSTSLQLERLQKQVDSQIKSETERVFRSLSDDRVANDPEARRILESLRQSGDSMIDLKKAADALAQVSFRILDPMMFALNIGTNLDAREGHALIGPCWGPDFADIIVEALGLKRDRVKERKLTSKLNEAGFAVRVTKLTPQDRLRDLDPTIPDDKLWDYYCKASKFDVVHSAHRFFSDDNVKETVGCLVAKHLYEMDTKKHKVQLWDDHVAAMAGHKDSYNSSKFLFTIHVHRPNYRTIVEIRFMDQPEVIEWGSALQTAKTTDPAINQLLAYLKRVVRSVNG